jgi:beta-phosphoglucomutase-like phosphatase (HAD superfamily)
MARYTDFAAVIFDVDDTLLDNRSRIPGRRLHERSRLAAIHDVAKRRGIPELQQVTFQENLEGFLTAPVHTLESAVWNIMFRRGLVAVNEPDPTNKIFQEIVELKNKLHEKLLRKEGQEVPGASTFVKNLAIHGFKGKMAIASTAVRRDIDIFLEKVELTPLFPDVHIISKDRVTHPKPHPEAFELAFQSLGLPPELKARTLVFEDDPRGIMAAKAAGMHVFAITVCFDKAKLEGLQVAPDFVADSYAEFAVELGLPATLKA